MKTLHFHKLYTPSDVSKIIQRKEEDIVKILEEGRAEGKNFRGFWYIRGREVIKIQKLLKEKVKNVRILNDGIQKEKEKKTEK